MPITENFLFIIRERGVKREGLTIEIGGVCGCGVSWLVRWRPSRCIIRWLQHRRDGLHCFDLYRVLAHGRLFLVECEPAEGNEEAEKKDAAQSV